MFQLLIYLVIISTFFLVPVYTTYNASVIIVGAGAAGMAAASKLYENGFTNLKIFEAENRIGGRIQTVQIGENLVDLGAEYLHGEENNVIYEIVRDLDLIEKSPTGFNKNFYSSNGTKFDAELSTELEMVINYYRKNLISKWNISTTGLSTGVLYSKIFNSYIRNKYRNNPEKFKIWTDSFHFAESVTNMAKSSYDWFEPSVDTHYENCKGHFYYQWKGKGFVSFLDLLLKKSPPLNGKIVLGKAVSTIHWNEESGIKLKCIDNSTYSADHVIFTPSLGVLKYHHNELFSPGLPRKKIMSIDKLGYGGVMKIVLDFPSRWWHEKDIHFVMFWTNQDIQNSANEFSEGPTENGISWTTRISVFIVPRHTKHILLAWLTGPLLPALEQMELETMKRGCTYVLDKFLSEDYNISKPTAIVRSSWYTNNNFKGSNSYETVANYINDTSFQNVLSEPLTNKRSDPVLLFAGEGTHPTHYGTAHGAVETGFREAYRIMNFYK